MSKSDFDEFAQRYDDVLGEAIPGSLDESEYFAEYKIRLMAEKYNVRIPSAVLDFGCGSGRSLVYLQNYFSCSDIWGYDISPASLEVARVASPETKLFDDWSSAKNKKFDLILAANVFHHIPRDNQLEQLELCRSHLGDGGEIFIFEHNPLNPLTRWIFERCPFDANAEMVPPRRIVELADSAGLRVIERKYTLFFPRPLSFLRGLESLLSRVPFGAQYYVRLEK